MKLVKISLKNHKSTDIKLRRWYLAKHRGKFHVGKFSRQWYGLNFDCDYGNSGLQFNPHDNYNGWEGLWEIRGRSS